MAARTPEDAVALSRQIGYPVVMKIDSPQISHKTDVDGVKLNLASDEAVAKAFLKMTARAKENGPTPRSSE